MIVSHVRVQPAMEAIMRSEASRVEAFLAAGHVCTVSGYDCYDQFASQYRVPVVVTGFEPLDLLSGILSCVRQLESGVAMVENRYERSVHAEGNRNALQVIDELYEVCDRPWRGLGTLQGGGFRLRDRWSFFDAVHRYPRTALPTVQPSLCRSGDVLTGRIKPTDCEYFGRECTQELPLGGSHGFVGGSMRAYARHARQTAS